MPSWIRHVSICSICRCVRHSTAISENARSDSRAPSRCASSIPTPPTSRPISLAIHTPSEKASGAATARTGAPDACARRASSSRAGPPLCAMTAFAASSTAGAER